MIVINLLEHFLIFIVIFIIQLHTTDSFSFELGPCLLQYFEPCSEEVIQYYLFTSDRPNSAPIVLNPKKPFIPDWVNLQDKSNKFIVHGYGGNLDFYATKAIRDGELN